MSHNVFPIGSRASAGPAALSSQRAADVVDLAARRSDPSPPPMPAELWDEMDAADRRWRDLIDHGQELRFHQCEDGGRMRATLCEVRSGAQRPLPLAELFGPGDDGPPTAA